MLRKKQGQENSYNLPDSINEINWNLKVTNSKVVDYYKNLIALRKAHPAFRMPAAEDIRANLQFKHIENGLISYQISNHANGDPWKNILVIYNANPNSVTYKLDGSWQLAVLGDSFTLDEQGKTLQNSVNVQGLSMLIAYQN
jgi:pullulanase